MFSMCRDNDLSRSHIDCHSSSKKMARGIASPQVNDYSNNELLSSSTKNTSRKNADKSRVKEVGETNSSMVDDSSSYHFSAY